MQDELNGYTLSRSWFDWCFENPEKVSPNHTAIYCFAIEQCNRLGWKEKFGFPTSTAMEALGIKKYGTYILYFNDLVEFGFIKLIEKSVNQHTANIISLNVAMPKNGKALDKANLKANPKATRKQPEGTGQSNSTVDKQVNKETIKPGNQETNINEPKGSYQKFVQIYSDWYQSRVGVKIMFDAVQGKAMKEIITYLIENSLKKDAQGGSEAWEYILKNWGQLSPFLRDQVKVNQIKSNLPNILNTLKNGNSAQKPRNSSDNISNLIDQYLEGKKTN